MIAGIPSMMNMPRHPMAFTRYPETIDIHSTVTGLPRIRKALVRERSALVNQWLRKISMPGSTTLSATPSRKRSAYSSSMLLIIPVSVASTPQSSRLQNISRLALRVSAYQAAGIWNRK